MLVSSDATLQKNEKTITDYFFDNKCSIKVTNETCVTRSVSRENVTDDGPPREPRVSLRLFLITRTTLLRFIFHLCRHRIRSVQRTRTPPNRQYHRVYSPKSKNDLNFTISRWIHLNRIRSYLSHVSSIVLGTTPPTYTRP